MPEFQGKMRLLADPLNVVGADIEIEEGSLALIVSNREIGEWPIAEVGIELAMDGFHLMVDGEEFVFMTTDRTGFAEAVGVRGSGVQTKVKPARQVKPEKHPARRPGRKRRRWLRQIDLRDRRVQILLGLFVALVALGVVARGFLTGFLLVSGMVGVVIASAAILDPILAARLPGELSPTKWAVAGLVTTAAGMVLLAV